MAGKKEQKEEEKQAKEGEQENLSLNGISSALLLPQLSKAKNEPCAAESKVSDQHYRVQSFS